MKIKLYVILLLSVLILTACKKKKKDEPAPTPVVTPTPVTPKLSVKVNGTDFVWHSETSSKGAVIRDVLFTNTVTSTQLEFKFNTYPATGAFSLVKYGNVSINYIAGAHYYNSVTGSFTLTERDTMSSGNFNKLKGNFNCKTDTFNSQFFDITNGTLNFTFQ